MKLGYGPHTTYGVVSRFRNLLITPRVSKHIHVPKYQMAPSQTVPCMLRCPIRKSFLDTSGSMCTSYSTLGNLEKEESQNAILFCIYIIFCFKRGVPIVLHENVRGFPSEILQDIAAEYGYDHVHIKCKPIDVGFFIGRPRKYLV